MMKTLIIFLTFIHGCVNYGQYTTHVISTEKVLLLRVDSTFFVEYNIVKAYKLTGDTVYYLSPKKLNIYNDTNEVILERFDIAIDSLEFTLRARYVGFAFSRSDKEVWTNNPLSYKYTLAGTGNLFIVRKVMK